MFVCVCNAVTDREIRNLARRGVDSLAELQMLTGCSGCCGHCADEAEALLESARGSRQGEPLPVIPMIETA